MFHQLQGLFAFQRAFRRCRHGDKLNVATATLPLNHKTNRWVWWCLDGRPPVHRFNQSGLRGDMFWQCSLYELRNTGTLKQWANRNHSSMQLGALIMPQRWELDERTRWGKKENPIFIWLTIWTAKTSDVPLLGNNAFSLVRIQQK